MFRTENKKSFLLPMVTVILCGTLSTLSPQTALADPTGTEYSVTLDGLLLDGAESTEGHFGSVIFDGVAELVPNDIVPPFPNFPGNDLIVTEDVIFNLDGSDTITIWVEGQDPGAPFPTPGAPLFANPLDPVAPVFFEVDGLNWGTTEAMFLSDISISLSFTGEIEIPIIPLDIGFTGAGTDIDPLLAVFTLDSPDFSDSMFGDATDLHLSFTVEHVVPEPASVTLLGVGVLALFAIVYRRRRVS